MEYTQNQVAVYLVLATPQFDSGANIEERRLGKYFKDVYGGPINKIETLKQIMFSGNVYVDEILFIGDSPED